MRKRRRRGELSKTLRTFFLSVGGEGGFGSEDVGKNIVAEEGGMGLAVGSSSRIGGNTASSRES